MANDNLLSDPAADALCAVAAAAYSAFTFAALRSVTGSGLAIVPALVGAATFPILTDMVRTGGDRISSFVEKHLLDKEEPRSKAR